VPAGRQSGSPPRANLLQPADSSSLLASACAGLGKRARERSTFGPTCYSVQCKLRAIGYKESGFKSYASPRGTENKDQRPDQKKNRERRAVSHCLHEQGGVLNCARIETVVRV